VSPTRHFSSPTHQLDGTTDSCDRTAAFRMHADPLTLHTVHPVQKHCNPSLTILPRFARQGTPGKPTPKAANNSGTQPLPEITASTPRIKARPCGHEDTSGSISYGSRILRTPAARVDKLRIPLRHCPKTKHCPQCRIRHRKHGRKFPPAHRGAVENLWIPPGTRRQTLRTATCLPRSGNPPLGGTRPNSSMKMRISVHFD
jgi:hypothetical protein